MPDLSELSHEVHLWFLPTTTLSESDLGRLSESVLSCEEQRRAERFAFARDRRSYITAHWLVRRALSVYVPVLPALWEFRVSPLGKPMIASPTEGLGLWFNLSHTAGMVACAVTRSGEVGVDVETVRSRDLLNLARRYFAPGEVAELESLPAELHPQAFFRLWTLKEAYIKACGQGLAMDLAGFAFPNVLSNEITIEFYKGIKDEPKQWCFFRHEPDPSHKIAVAVKHEMGARPVLKIFHEISQFP
jgi:4'-phosphopantetheinyl transferase